MNDGNQIDRATTTTWPALVAMANSYLGDPDPCDHREYAKHFAAGIVAMDRELTRIAGGGR